LVHHLHKDKPGCESIGELWMGTQHGFTVGFLAGLELSKELRRESFDFVGRL
jgi:hypothetical protein